jgi:hypothetical protein
MVLCTLVTAPCKPTCTCTLVTAAMQPHLGYRPGPCNPVSDPLPTSFDPSVQEIELGSDQSGDALICSERCPSTLTPRNPNQVSSASDADGIPKNNVRASGSSALSSDSALGINARRHLVKDSSHPLRPNQGLNQVATLLTFPARQQEIPGFLERINKKAIPAQGAQGASIKTLGSWPSIIPPKLVPSTRHPSPVTKPGTKLGMVIQVWVLDTR